MASTASLKKGLSSSPPPLLAGQIVDLYPGTKAAYLKHEIKNPILTIAKQQAGVKVPENSGLPMPDLKCLPLNFVFVREK